tara:strand:- start:78 stop:605 length:528 start_codon:yes stop_codon:yes gene_type:complete
MAQSFAAARYALQKDAGEEQKKLEKESREKGLWGSIGSTLGSLAAMGLTAGMVNPLTVGLITGAASGIGGAIGSASKKISGGKFHKGARDEMGNILRDDIIKSSLTSAVTAGATTAAKPAAKSGPTISPELLENYSLDELAEMGVDVSGLNAPSNNKIFSFLNPNNPTPFSKQKI